MISEEYMIEKLVDITPQNISLKGSQIIDFHYRAGSLEIIVTLDGVNSDFRFFLIGLIHFVSLMKVIC
ncbi:hypothetical protein SEEB8392_05549 [Salmonella enterica subsp. enterica serovar Berta str. ATCC 8392]|nr:hypothetical protein SEEB8392_05549 [Salmonella enterica subsp. enterica serovar Berta str. ATCC 8392]KSU35707.1 hypothetical protein ACG11_15770 [Salmonella enterica subsp. enterica serovar Enteritidis]